MFYKLGYAYNVAIAAASTLGSRPAPFGVTHFRVVATNDCYIAIGPTPVATVANGTLIRGNSEAHPEVFLINSGDQIAVINASGSPTGELNVTELTR